MEELPTLRLKGYLDVLIVGMRHHYKGSDGECLPRPLPGCPVSLQLEPSNQWDHNAIKVINEVNKRHLGYVIGETSKYLSPFLQANTSVAARGILSIPRDPRCSSSTISCHVLLFFAGPPQLGPPLPPQLEFHEDLSSSCFLLVDTLVSFTGCTLDAYDSYVANYLPLLQNQCQVEQTFLRPCSTNANFPVHVHDGDATAPLDPSKFQTQTQTQAGTQFEVQDTTQKDELTCIKCNQTGVVPFFKCASGVCPLLIHESCIGDVIGDHCHFCLYLARRKEYHELKKENSSCMAACREDYKKAKASVIQLLGGNMFMRLLELTGLGLLSPQQVQSPQSTDIASDEAAICNHIAGSDGTIDSNNSVRVVDQTKTGTDSSLQTKAQCQILAAERNDLVCMKCKQMGGGSFFQCARSGCPVRIHESCMHAVVGGWCSFCLFLAIRGELLKGEKGSDSYKALKSRYVITRDYAIQFFGKKTFMELRELAGLDIVLPAPVQVPCSVNMQCTTDGGEGEAVLTGTTRAEIAAKENKEKAKDGKSSRKEKMEETELVGHGNRRLPPRQSLLRACKRRCQHYDNLGNHFLPISSLCVQRLSYDN